MSPGTKSLDEFEQAVENSSDLDEGIELKGADLGVTIGTLLEYGKNYSQDITVIVSTRSDTPYPLGIDTTVDDLNEMVELIRTFGPRCMSGLEYDEDGTLHVGYHFD